MVKRKRRYFGRFLLILAGISGCTAVDTATADATIGEQLRTFAVDFVRQVLAAFLF